MTVHATIPLDYGCRTELTPASSLDGGGLLYYVGHTYIGFYPDEHATEIHRRIVDLHRTADRIVACAYPTYRFASISIPNPELLQGEKDMDLLSIKTKPEAVAFVCAVLKSDAALSSPNFNTAVDVSRVFDITVQDVLDFRRIQQARLV